MHNGHELWGEKCTKSIHLANKVQIVYEIDRENRSTMLMIFMMVNLSNQVDLYVPQTVSQYEQVCSNLFQKRVHFSVNCSRKYFQVRS